MPNGLPKVISKVSKILKNHQNPPQSASWDAILRWPWKKNMKKQWNVCFSGQAYLQSVHACAVQTHFSLFLLLLENASKRHPKCSLLDTFGAPLASQMPPNIAFKLFCRRPKKSYFLKGFRWSLWAQIAPKMPPPPHNFLTPFWYLFLRGTPHVPKVA